MAKYPKTTQYAHQSRSALGQVVNFALTPYEAITFAANSDIGVNPGYEWDGLSNPPNRFNVGSVYRPDIRLVRASSNGMGSVFYHETKGRGVSYKQLYGNRSIFTEMKEYIDGGNGVWRCYTGGLVANSVIKDDGITSRRGPQGQDILGIDSATPDYFLGRLNLPQMSYILGELARRERAAQYSLATYGIDPARPPANAPSTPIEKKNAIQARVGYLLQGDGQGGMADGVYQDPLMGFGAYRNQYSSTVNQLMQPVGANELHLCRRLSSSRVVTELIHNHTKANGKPIQDIYGFEVLASKDIEYDLFTFDTSGTFNSIIQDMASHGVWLTYWDTKSNFHFVPHYYWGPNYKVGARLVDGPSLIGNLDINLGTPSQRVAQVQVKGQPFISFGDATSDALTTNTNMKLGAVYPPNSKVGDVGRVITMDGYMGRNCDVQAQRLYNKENAQTTFRWSKFPYPTLAMALYHKVISITIKDPNGAFDFTAKDFWVDAYTVELQDPDRPDGGYYECSVSGVEITLSQQPDTITAGYA